MGAFQSLSHLSHLDLCANNISSLSSGLFESNSHLQTLLLSRNPLRSLIAGIFHGITQLRTLSLSFVQTRICVDEDAFVPLRQLTDLQLDNSPWLAATFVSSPDLVRTSLAGLSHLSLQRTDLAHLESSFFSAFFPNVESVRLSSSAWVCDEHLAWLGDWLMTSSLASELDRQANRCAEPAELAARQVVSLADDEFKQPRGRSPPHRRAQLRTGNSKISTENADTECSERSRTTFNVAMVTPTSALSSLRGRQTTSTLSATSQLRHGDVSNDVGLVQVILIVCTLIVTLVLSAIIISIIVRLTSRHRPDSDVISGVKSPRDVSGSRVSVRHCPPEDMTAEGWRSRASSLSRSSRAGGGRVADYQRPAGSRKLVCDDVSDRLVKVDGGGTRLTDEQSWRVYTWEDT